MFLLCEVRAIQAIQCCHSRDLSMAGCGVCSFATVLQSCCWWPHYLQHQEYYSAVQPDYIQPASKPAQPQYQRVDISYIRLLIIHGICLLLDSIFLFSFFSKLMGMCAETRYVGIGVVWLGVSLGTTMIG